MGEELLQKLIESFFDSQQFSCQNSRRKRTLNWRSFQRGKLAQEKNGQITPGKRINSQFKPY